MELSSAIFEGTVAVVPDRDDTLNNAVGPDRHQVLLDAADVAIDRLMSDDPVEFLNRCKQARGE